TGSTSSEISSDPLPDPVLTTRMVEHGGGGGASASSSRYQLAAVVTAPVDSILYWFDSTVCMVEVLSSSLRTTTPCQAQSVAPGVHAGVSADAVASVRPVPVRASAVAMTSTAIRQACRMMGRPRS